MAEKSAMVKRWPGAGMKAVRMSWERVSEVSP
jgi:hypothetical protein